MTREMVPTVATLWRYPVKSMMGEELNAGAITPRGLHGDRAYALFDLSTRKVASAKNPRKWPNLFNYRAGYITPPEAESIPPVRVTLPDGRMTVSTDPEFRSVLSAVLGREVALLSAAPEAAQLEEYWPDMEGLAHRDAITDESMPPGTFFDLAFLHLLTTGTLNKLRELSPGSRFEARRFRPNLVIDTPGEAAFVENGWIGRKLLIGDQVQLEVTGPCPRCVMTTLAQGDLPKDPAILKTAAKYNGVQVGVYATVIRGGTIKKSDTVIVQ